MNNCQEAEDRDKIKVPKFTVKNGYCTSTLRSKQMSKIRSINSKPELTLRRALWKKKLRYTTHPSFVFGKPDIFIQKYRLAIFVDGSFWHGYNWAIKKKKIKNNSSFWIPKIERNIQRDQEVNKTLTDRGYVIMRFWDHEILGNGLDKCVNQILLYVESCKMGIIPSNY